MRSTRLPMSISKTGLPTPSNLLPDIKPWQRIDWAPRLQARIFRSWGEYYTRRVLNRKALDSYDRALTACETADLQGSADKGNICSARHNLLSRRSRCERSIGMIEESLKHAERACEMMKYSSNNTGHRHIVLDKCDSLYDSNKYVENLMCLFSEQRKVSSSLLKDAFKRRQQQTMNVFDNACGQSLGFFMSRNHAAFMESSQRHKAQMADTVIERPLWKALKEQNICDIESVREVPVPYVTPLEQARRRLHKKVYNYRYLGPTAQDVMLLRKLRNDKNFLNPLLQSMPYMKAYNEQQYKAVNRFVKMLHSRNPMYNQYAAQCLDKERCERNSETYLYHVQYQTRRDCFSILRQLRKLRRAGNIDKLTHYANQTVTTYVAEKTRRTLPWKFEFINEVYNILGLAFADRCSVPVGVDLMTPENRDELFQLPTGRSNNMRTAPPLDRNVPHAMPKSVREQRQSSCSQDLEKLQYMLLYSRYPIERSYLLYEIARCNFKKLRYNVSMSLANKAMKEAVSCNSVIWQFNCRFLICQIFAALNHLGHLETHLIKATQVAEQLHSMPLVAYLRICRLITDKDLALQRLRFSQQHKFTNNSVDFSDHVPPIRV